MKPNIYLDIDLVILANEKNAANGADDFLQYLIANYPVTWATTHVMHNDPETAISRLKDLLKPETVALLPQIRGASWSVAKTELFDFSKPFLFIDDDLYDDEREVLIQHNCLANWIEIDLSKNENQLLDLLTNFPVAIQPTPIAATI